MVRPRGALAGVVGATFVSSAGNTATVVAAPFFVLSLGGGPAQVGLAAAAASAPVVVGSVLGGVLVDRLGHRRTSVASDVASGTTSLAVAVLALTAGLPFAAFCALLVLGALVDAPGQSARLVMLPRLATRADVPLQRAVGLGSGAERLGQTLGAPLGGLLVVVVGPAGAFATTAAGFAASAVLVLACAPSGRLLAPTDDAGTPDPAGAAPPQGFWADLLDGVRALRRIPVLAFVAVVCLALNLLDAARWSVLLPLHAEAVLGGATAVGLVLGALSAGSVGGAVLYSAVGHRLPHRGTFVAAFVLTGGPTSVALATGASLPVLVVVAAAAGLSGGVLNPLIGVLRLELCPPHLLARVDGLVRAAAWSGIPVGTLLAGALAGPLGLATCFAAIGVVYVAVALVPLVGRPWPTAPPEDVGTRPADDPAATRA